MNLMNFFIKNCFIYLFLLLSIPVKSLACSAFMLKGNDYCLVGFNENWKTMPGMVVVNQHGIKKTSLSWKALVSPKKINEKTATWTSKYGSVSFNLLGYDLPCYGVNEKGLFLVELYLEKTSPIKDASKANMFWGQWIQYQLDNFSSVQELVDNLKNVPVIDWWPSAAGSHFFASDSKGNTAAIELIDGKIKVTLNEEMPIPLLCNEEYAQDLAAVNEFDFRGGTKNFDFEKATKWEDRFSRASYMLENYETSKASPLYYSWTILDNIYSGEWQMVADLKNKKIYFRSNVGEEIKSIDMAKINFAPNSDLKFVDINSNLNGDVTSKFSNLTPEINQSYILQGFPVGYDNKEFPESNEFLVIRKNLDLYFKKTFKK